MINTCHTAGVKVIAGGPKVLDQYQCEFLTLVRLAATRYDFQPYDRTELW